MNIIKGKQKGAKKIVIYGPEGIGKSTFASKFSDPLFIDTEGSTKNMDVSRTEKPSSWTMLLSQIQYVKSNPDICRTLVIDTIDWAEQLCLDYICSSHQKSGIEDFGYGNGYVYEKEEFGRFLNLLSDVVEAGVHVVLTAHAQIRKFEQPDELGAYDRYELKLGKKTSSQISPLVKEWADMVLFANYKTYSIAVDKDGKKHKAQGGKRVMYTSHHPCWDAKNRDGLPEELPFEYAAIAEVITDPEREAVTKKGHEAKEAPRAETKAETKPEAKAETKPTPDPMPKPEQKSRSEPDVNVPEGVDEEVPFDKKEPSKIPRDSVFKVDDKIPKALRDLMEENLVSEEEIRKAVSREGYYPLATPIINYDPDFITGVLVGAWTKVLKKIMDMRSHYDIPFNQ